MIRIVYLTALIVAIATPTQGHARGEDRTKQITICKSETSGPRAVTTDAKIKACTFLIESRSFQPRDTSWLYIYRSNAYAALPDNVKMIEDLASAVEVDPTFSYAWAKSCSAQNWQVNDTQRALAECNRAVALDTKDAGALAHRGDVYLNLRQYPDAISDYTKSIALNGAWMWPRINRAIAYRQSGQFDLAIRDLGIARSMAPNFAMPYIETGITHLVMGSEDQALASFERGLSADPRCAACVYGRGLIKKRKGDEQGGVADLALAKEWDADADRDFKAAGVSATLN